MINTPEIQTEQEILAKIKENITISSLEVKRLQTAERTVKTDIQEALATKATIAGSIESLNTDRDSLRKEIKSFMEEHTKASTDLRDVRNQIILAESELSEVKIKLSAEKANIDVERTQFEREKEAFATELQNLNENKRDHQAKVDKLKLALE